MKNRIFIVLVVLDLFWFAAASVYDYPAITTIPFYFWPFIIICPIFPFLLMLVWLSILRKRKVNPYLLTFAAFPSVIYGIGVLIFYPTVMYYNGFDWRSFGQIFWVLFYGLQGGYLLLFATPSRCSSFTPCGKRHFFTINSIKWNLFPILLATSFVITSILIQFFTKTFGYLAFDLVPSNILFAEMIGLVSICIIITSILTVRSKAKRFS